MAIVGVVECNSRWWTWQTSQDKGCHSYSCKQIGVV